MGAPIARWSAPFAFRVMALIAVFSGSFILLYTIINRLPVTRVSSSALSLPWTLEDAKKSIILLDQLKDDHYYEVIILIFTTFVWLQAFALPGTILYILACGMLFRFPVALAITALASAFGALSCYTISMLFCGPVVEHYLATNIAQLRTQVNKLDGKFLAYMLFIRATPFLPNWLVNVASPIVGVPVVPFFVGTLFGVMPSYFLFLRVGKKLHDFAKIEEVVMPWGELAILWVGVILIAMPVIFKNQLATKLGISMSQLDKKNE